MTRYLNSGFSILGILVLFRGHNTYFIIKVGLDPVRAGMVKDAGTMTGQVRGIVEVFPERRAV